MELFRYENVQKLNSSELRVYNYVVAHQEKAARMSIRQMVQETGVSTTTILRFCEKMGLEGYQELKFRLTQRLEQKPDSTWNAADGWHRMFTYWQQSFDDAENRATVQSAAKLLSKAKAVHFLGVGTSGSLAEYGARYLANMGIASVAVLDPFYPKATFDLTGTVLVVLSVSGETQEALIQVDGYKSHHAQIITITNTKECSLARLADCSLTYYMPALFPPAGLGPHNITSQVPVVFYLEMLAHATYEKKNGQTT